MVAMALSCSKKKLSTLLIGIISIKNSDFCYLKCLYSFKTKSKLESHKRVCGYKDFCNAIMLSEDTKVL